MIVVSDTSPLRYLILVRAIDVLPALLGEVLIPPAVAAELMHAKTPAAVRDWFQSPPPWVKFQAPRRVDAIARLGPGEQEAIALALELDADRLLIDDNAGKQAAKRLGLNAIGTLAILDLADKQGLLDLRQALDRLENVTNFRMSRVLRDRLLEEDWNDSDETNDPRESWRTIRCLPFRTSSLGMNRLRLSGRSRDAGWGAISTSAIVDNSAIPRPAGKPRGSLGAAPGRRTTAIRRGAHGRAPAFGQHAGDCRLRWEWQADTVARCQPAVYF